MAQAAQFIVQYIAGMTVIKGNSYTTADVIATYPTATTMILKTKVSKGEAPITVSIDGTDAFEITYDDPTYIETGNTFIFNKNCTIAIAKYISAV